MALPVIQVWPYYACLTTVTGATGFRLGSVAGSYTLPELSPSNGTTGFRLGCWPLDGFFIFPLYSHLSLEIFKTIALTSFILLSRQSKITALESNLPGILLAQPIKIRSALTKP
jgi:hypothetical protein